MRFSRFVFRLTVGVIGLVVPVAVAFASSARKGAKTPFSRRTSWSLNCTGATRNSECETRRELETPGTELGDDSPGRPEIRIWACSPELVRAVCWIHKRTIDGVLHIVNHVLLEVRVIENIEGLRSE